MTCLERVDVRLALNEHEAARCRDVAAEGRLDVERCLTEHHVHNARLIRLGVAETILDSNMQRVTDLELLREVGVVPHHHHSRGAQLARADHWV